MEALPESPCTETLCIGILDLAMRQLGVGDPVIRRSIIKYVLLQGEQAKTPLYSHPNTARWDH